MYYNVKLLNMTISFNYVSFDLCFSDLEKLCFVGLKDGRVKDNAFTSLTTNANGHRPSYGRLDLVTNFYAANRSTSYYFGRLIKTAYLDISVEKTKLPLVEDLVLRREKYLTFFLL